MFVTSVLPIKKGVRRSVLSYFSPEKVVPGSIVMVPIRGKNYSALVLTSEEAKDAKAEIKASSFALRKVESLKSEPFLTESWLRAVNKSALHFATTEGEVISSLIPTIVLDNLPKLKKKKLGKRPEQKGESLVHQAEEEERILNYRSAVRQAFAKKSSVFIVLPTNRDIEVMSRLLEKGIKKYVFPFYTEMPKGEMIKKWNAAVEEEHPILILGSASWLCLPRGDLETIIMEKENRSGWRTLRRPYLDLRKFTQIYASELGARLIEGDTVLRVETFWKYKQDLAIEFESVKSRIYPTQTGEIVDMQKSEFKAVSPELLSLIKKNREENKNTFIYATRKGLASVTVCRDCGEEVVCTNCASPVVLYKGQAENIFHCHQCGEVRSAKEFCRRCGSWRLIALGVGIERVEEEIREAIPDIKIFKINKEATPSQKSALEQAEGFYDNPGSILLGTEMAMYFLKTEVDATAVASIDPLFFVPDWRIREKIFHLLLDIRLLARERCSVQTRKAGGDTIALALAGNIVDFYKEEIKEREPFQYPPFGTFIKITTRGTKLAVKQETEVLKGFFEKWNPVIFQSSTERRTKEAAANCVIKLGSGEWPNEELRSRILSLPPNFEVKVNPDNLL